LIRKDYIQRYFDELAKVLAAVLQLKNDFKPIEAETKLNDFSSAYLGVDIESIIQIKTVELITTLIEKNQFTLTHFKILEDILYYKYLMNSKNQKLKKSTLEILNYLAEIDSDYSVERINRIEELTI
jgi:hypothetical protein